MDGEEAGRCSSQGDAKLQVLQMSEEGVACLKSVSCILKPIFSASCELIRWCSNKLYHRTKIIIKNSLSIFLEIFSFLSNEIGAKSSIKNKQTKTDIKQ